MIYLDNNSTTRPCSAAVRGMHRAMEEFWGNPGNLHSAGERARNEIQRAAKAVSKFLGIEEDSAVGFTFGGTDANQKVVGYIAKNGKRVAFLKTEHSSVLEAYSKLEQVESHPIPVDSGGLVKLGELESIIVREGIGAISIQWANSETGVIQPIAKIAELCQKYSVILHADAAQVIGKISLDKNLIDKIDFLTFTAHKLHGPQGIGVIVLGGRQLDFQSVFPDSHTPNMPGIVSFGEVLSERLESNIDHFSYLESLRDGFEKKLLSLHPELVVNGATSPRIPNTTNIRFSTVDGAALVGKLDLEGVMCSQVSACLVGRPEPSYVLVAMGLDEEEARSSIRFSFSMFNTPDEVATSVDIISRCYMALLEHSLKLVS